MKALQTLALAALLVTGCAKKDAATAEHLRTNNSSGNPLSAPVDYLGAVNQGRKKALKTIDHTALHSAIQLFNAQEERLPRDLNELVAKGYISTVPTPPAGSRFQYNPQTGDLKIVPQ